MAAVSPLLYAEFYCVVTNNPHDGDPSAIFEDERRRCTSGGFGPRQPTSYQPSVGTITQTRTYCLRRGEMGTPSPPFINSRYASELVSPQTAEMMLAGVALTSPT